MQILWDVLYVAVGAWIVLGMLFPAYPTIHRLHKEGVKLGLVIRIPMFIALVLGLLADVLFNAIWGTLIFRELPKEWLFTDRLKRHWRGENAKQIGRAANWVHRVNLVDPGHVVRK